MASKVWSYAFLIVLEQIDIKHKRMRLFLQVFTLFLVLSLPKSLAAQATDTYAVQGVIKDSRTEETLPFANVFFSGTTFGTVSDKDGVFTLKADGPGTYELIVSYTGYKIFSQKIKLNAPGTREFAVEMVPEARYLGGVVVTAKKDREWKRNLGIFQRVFLGYSRNSVSCKIINEEILYFEYDEEKEVLEAYAGEPLIIENRSLGYRLTYALESFKIHYNDGYSAFHGYPSFEELNPEEKVKKKWIKARDRAFRGSVVHFFRELYKGTAAAAGYAVSAGEMVDEVINITKDGEFNINTLVAKSTDGSQKELFFKDLLFIEYRNESPEPGYRLSLSPEASPKILNSAYQISWLQMPERETKAIFEESGLWVNIRDFVLEGYWSYEKIADLVPTNYQPASKDK